jgi:hypothetical protein
MIIKTLGAVAIVTASLSSPLFAQDTAAPQQPVHALRQHYRGTYDQVREPEFAAPHVPAGESYFDHDSYDPSRVGGRNPNFNPPS